MNIGKTPEQVRPHFENMVLFIAALLELKPEIGLREIELQPFFQLAGSFSTCTASPPPAAHRRVKVLIHEAGNAGSTESPFFVPYLHLLAAKASSEDGSRWVFARLDSEKSGSSIINRKQFLREIEEHIQRYEPDAYTQQGFGNVYGFGGTKPRYRQPRSRSLALSYSRHRLGSASMQKEQQRQREEELGREQKRVGVILLLLSRILANLPDSRLALRVCPPIHCLLACSFSPH